MDKKMPLSFLKTMSKEFIEQNNIELFDTWNIKDEAGQSWGPFHTNDLKEISQEHQEAFESYIAINLATEKEKPFFQNTKFQRRKPKLVSIQGLQTIDSFYLLIQGIKKGPFKLDEVKQMVDANQIRLNILVSIDKGNSWIKLFEHHEFDRRLLKNKEELPHSPKKQELESESLVSNITGKGVKKFGAKDALIGLAFMGRGNDKGQKINQVQTKILTEEESQSTIMPHTKEQKHNVPNDKDVKAKTPYKKIGSIAAAVAVVITVSIAGVNFFNTQSSSSVANSEFKPSRTSGITQKPQRSVRTKSQNRMPTNNKNGLHKSHKQPTKVIKAKKYKPIKRKYRKINSAKRYKHHKNNRIVDPTIDLDDINERDEYPQDRDIASRGNDQLSDEEREFIERAERGEFDESELEEKSRQMENKREEFDEY